MDREKLEKIIDTIYNIYEILFCLAVIGCMIADYMIFYR